MRVAIILTLDVADHSRVPPEELIHAVRKLQEILGSDLPEHRPLLTLSIDEEHLKIFEKIEDEVANASGFAAGRADRLARNDYLPEEGSWV